MEIGAIYCDMDQVLVNFLGGARKVLGKEFNDPCLGKDNDKWVVLATVPSFWTNLDWMPCASILWEEIKGRNTFILSACPPKELNPLCPEQKKLWCQIQLGLSTERVHTVSRSEKQNFAVTDGKPNLLIDDHYGNVNDWCKAGGYAIHHHTIPETMTQLRQFVSQEACHHCGGTGARLGYGDNLIDCVWCASTGVAPKTLQSNS
jgi:hypothetical protein